MTEFARTMSDDNIVEMIRTLSRRPAGRQAILNCPTVLREITSNKRQVSQSHRLRRGKEMVKMVGMASRAKGHATKTTKKLKSVTSRNKGLQTMLSKVSGNKRDVCEGSTTLNYKLLK